MYQRGFAGKQHAMGDISAGRAGKIVAGRAMVGECSGKAWATAGRLGQSNLGLLGLVSRLVC